MTRVSPLRVSALLLAAAASACLDPLVSDEPGLPGLILPRDAAVPSIHDDRGLERQIDLYDGVPGMVPLVNAFAEDVEIAYWDFGPAPSFAAPLFRLVRRTAGGALEPVAEHPTIIESIPGQPGYSPFWAVLDVAVTDLYDGELLISFEAVQEAQRLGLVESPAARDPAVNCPVVAADVTLELGDGPAPRMGTAFWEGWRVDYYDFGEMAVERAAPPVRPRYVLHRVGDEPVSEVLRGIDLNGDGDRNDTNDVLTGRPGLDDYSPLCETVEVAVVDETVLIDNTTADVPRSTVRAAADLVVGPDTTEAVAGIRATGELRNCPQQAGVADP